MSKRYRTKRDRLIVAIQKFNPTKTDASFERECRIDRILYKYSHNLPLENWQINNREGAYLDITNIPRTPEEFSDFLKNVNEQFNKLPAVIRREYHDNAFEFAHAVSGQDFETSEAAKRVDLHLREQTLRLNPTLAAIMEKAKEASSMQVQQLAEVLNNKPSNEKEKNNEA